MPTNVLVKTPSPPYVAATGSATQQLEGQPSFRPMNASVTSFQLQSVCLLCASITIQGSALPISCTLQFAGRNAKTQEAKVKEAEFAPAANPAKTQYACTMFPAGDFSGLDLVQTELVQSSIPQVGVVVLLDNLSYKATQKCQTSTSLGGNDVKYLEGS